MADYKVRRLRPDAHQVGIYNSAATVYLYDETHGAAITRASPSLLQGFHGDAAHDVDAALIALGEQGMLVVFELYQDDELQAEVSLGPPLAGGEAGGSGIPWSEAQSTFLSLPSGALCIESMDCLRLGPEAPTDQGARLSLPPGDYVVSIQCLGREYEQDADDLVPEYFISLVPAQKGARLPNRPFLAHPR